VAAGPGQDGDWLTVIARPAGARPGRNLAGEPRDEVEPGPDAEVHHGPAGTAIGTTQEHRLRLTTTRLWSWRDEDGTEAECRAELGRATLAAARGAGGDRRDRRALALAQREPLTSGLWPVRAAPRGR
jgi:hypothetical protein